MKNLIKVETGTFVYHKEFGRGIVTNPNSHYPYQKDQSNYIAVWFEGQQKPKRLNRKEIFVRGDKIEIQTGFTNMELFTLIGVYGVSDVSVIMKIDKISPFLNEVCPPPSPPIII